MTTAERIEIEQKRKLTGETKSRANISEHKKKQRTGKGCDTERKKTLQKEKITKDVRAETIKRCRVQQCVRYHR